MRLETPPDATGTVLTPIHHRTLTGRIPFSWWEPEATQGYASRVPEPQLTALGGTIEPVGFVGMYGSMMPSIAWIRSEPVNVDIADFLWGTLATAHEIVVSPSLAADLCSLDRLQQTEYRLSLRDALKDLREALAVSLAAPGRVVVEPQVLGGEHDGAWVEQLAELKQLADLTNDQLAELFDVSRTSVQQWLVGGGMRTGNREHLRQLLGIFRDAFRRHESSQRLHEVLMMPVGERQRRPFDHLAEKRYAIARGYLQRRPAVERHRARRPIRPRVPRSEAERMESLEQLSPPPRDSRDDR